MSCKKCKEKKLVSQETKKQFISVDTKATIGILIWFALGAYGLISLILNIIR